MRGILHNLILLLAVVGWTGTLHSQSTNTDPSEVHHLRAGDTVQIVVFEEQDLSVQLKLDQEGVVVIPLLGRINLEGQSLREAEKFLENKFIEEEFLIHPQVTVSIVQHAQQVFYIYGEVNNPGAKPLPAGRQYVDILEAITLAGDLSQYAKRSDIVLRRPIEGTDQEEKITIDLDKVIRGGKGEQNPLIRIYPRDIIFVPERLF